MSKLGKAPSSVHLAFSQRAAVQSSPQLQLQRSLPYLNTIARNSILCKNEQRRYAVCVSGKGITVEKDECLPQFQSLMDCLGLNVKK